MGVWPKSEFIHRTFLTTSQNSIIVNFSKFFSTYASVRAGSRQPPHTRRSRGDPSRGTSLPTVYARLARMPYICRRARFLAQGREVALGGFVTTRFRNRCYTPVGNSKSSDVQIFTGMPWVYRRWITLRNGRRLYATKYGKTAFRFWVASVKPRSPEESEKPLIVWAAHRSQKKVFPFPLLQQGFFNYLELNLLSMQKQLIIVV